jgi:hypothetical protein
LSAGSPVIALSAPQSGRLGSELAELAALQAAHRRDALVAALERAITFGRWRASGVRSILAAGAGVAQPTAASQALMIELPRSASRSSPARQRSPGRLTRPRTAPVSMSTKDTVHGSTRRPPR